jgi:4-amino-4-deoxy-L-arabinose transferase-like glycosyltransferase
MLTRPVRSITVIALAVRVTTALGAQVATSGTIVPDEVQYRELARILADGQGAAAFFNGYGVTLLRSTWAYTTPLTILTKLFGAHYLNGRLLSAVCGAALAGVVVKLVLRTGDRRRAVAAGLLVALFPSQVFWSSASIRESMVWLGLAIAAMGVGAMVDPDPRRWLRGATVGAIGLGLVGLLRDQTMVAATWALVLTVVVLPGPRRLQKVGTVLLIALCLPWATGSGPFGSTLVRSALPKLGTLRVYGEIDAATGFIATTTIPRPRDETIGNGGVSASPPPPVGATTTTTATTLPPVKNGQRVVANAYIVDETAGASIKHLPQGLVATTLRPYPWEPGTSTSMSLARVENILWYLLYLLAAVGAIALRRRRDVVVFPVLCILAVSAASAVSQGNLGTAFRHRGQLLWALAVLGVFGVTPVVEWGRRRSAQRREDRVPATE